MRLNKIIVEARERSVYMAPEQCFEGIKNHCKRALADHKEGKRIYRGMHTDGESYIVKPGEHTRISANTYNTYTMLIDNSKRWAKYPKRSKSIICSTVAETSEAYGYTYVVFPKDGFKIGVCPNYDMWHSFYNTLNGRSLLRLNTGIEDLIHHLSVDFNIDHIRKYEDLELMCKNIDIVVNNTENPDIKYDWFSNYNGDFMDLLENILDPEDNKFKVETDIGKLPSGNHEVWTDSDSYLISLDWLMAGNNERLIG